jgi:hypothetical protein
LNSELATAGTAVPGVKIIVQVTGESSNFGIGDLAVRILRRYPPNWAHWGFAVLFVANNDDGEFVVHFNMALYDPARVRAFTGDLCRLFKLASQHPDQSIKELLAAAGVTWKANDDRSWLSRLLRT